MKPERENIERLSLREAVEVLERNPAFSETAKIGREILDERERRAARRAKLKFWRWTLRGQRETSV